MKKTAIVLTTAFALSCSVIASPIAEDKMEVELIENQNEMENVFSSNRDRYIEIVQEGLRIQEERLEQERLEAERIAKEEAEEEAERERLRIEEENRRNSVSVNLNNVLEISNIKAEELIAVFDFYEYSKPMKELAYAIVEAEQTYGVNAFILASIVSWESSYNTSDRATNGSNNIMGWNVTSESAKGSYFNSKSECIMTATKFLRENYLSETGIYYNGLSTWGVSRRYCNPPEEWLEGINQISCEYLWVYKYLF